LPGVAAERVIHIADSEGVAKLANAARTPAS
jgi:hypothetical protein